MTGNTDLHNDLPPADSKQQGPGQLVRQAREKAMTSLEDLAAQIKLARSTLDAIERDDFAQLNEPVYVRGYYRKLAKVLPVAESDLLAAYQRVAGHTAPPQPSKLILAGEGATGGSRLSSKLLVIIVLLGLFMGAMVFWGKNRSNTPKLPVSVVPTSTGSVPALSESLSLVPASTEPLPLAASELSTELPASSAATAPASTPATASGPLKLQFSGTSWTEVKDATGSLLLSGLLQSGNSQVLNGQPPFVVVLGNAPVVRITYNGQPVDVNQFRRGDNTARITLP